MAQSDPPCSHIPPGFALSSPLFGARSARLLFYFACSPPREGEYFDANEYEYRQASDDSWIYFLGAKR